MDTPDNASSNESANGTSSHESDSTILQSNDDQSNNELNQQSNQQSNEQPETQTIHLDETINLNEPQNPLANRLTNRISNLTLQPQPIPQFNTMSDPSSEQSSSATNIPASAVQDIASPMGSDMSEQSTTSIDQIAHRSINQSFAQSTCPCCQSPSSSDEHSTHQSVPKHNHPISQLSDVSNNQINRPSNDQPINQATNQPTIQTVNPSVTQPERKSASLNDVTAPPVSYGTFDPPRNQSSHHSVNTLSNRSIHQAINHFRSQLPPHILVDHSDLDTDTESELESPLEHSANRSERSWFGASHYDQFDQSYKIDSPINQSMDESLEHRKTFKRIKKRYGHVTYFVAPSARSASQSTIQQSNQSNNQTINLPNEQPVQRAPFHARRRLSSPFRNKRNLLESIARSSNPLIDQSTFAQTVRRSNTQSHNRTINESNFDELYNNELTLQSGQLAPPLTIQSNNQLANERTTNQSTNQPRYQLNDQTFNQSIPESTSISINPNHSNDQSNNQSINQTQSNLKDFSLDPSADPEDLDPPTETDETHKLSEWPATALSANSISSSCLYAISFALSTGGIWAPLCFVFVIGVLYLFRFIYSECVTALPMNGGAYNVLLNTTSKKTAAVLGCLSLLSYLATAVVSAASGLSYLQFIWPGCNIDIGVVILIVTLALVNLWGIQESANLALGILMVHLATLFILFVTAVVHLSTTHDQEFTHNMTESSTNIEPNIGMALLQGFGAAMLGISGFETSANFVEEQKTGVFSKTLRNMWALVSVINPTFCLLIVCVVPLEVALSHANKDVLIAYFAKMVGGDWCMYLLCIDAFGVLSASVLTSYVGVTGLARRLTLDRGLPQLLLHTNPYRGTNHWIILAFCCISIILYFIVSGDVVSLGNVYTLSFLLVMTGFAVGNMLLKLNRPGLRREVTAPWSYVVFGLCFVLLAFSATIARDPSVLAVWGIFFVVALSIVGLMFFRVKLLKAAYFFVSKVLAYFKIRESVILTYMERMVDTMSNDQAVFFSKHGRLEAMNQAVLYVLENEEATRIRIVHVYEDEWNIPSKIARNVAILDSEYSEVQVSLVLVKGTFSVETVDFIAHELKVEKNMMFLTAPRQDFRIKLETLGGVRLIIK